MFFTWLNFFIRYSFPLAGGAVSLVSVEGKDKESAPADFKDWESVRRQFELAPDYIHFALFFLASHPRSVRQAIEQYRARIDAIRCLQLRARFSCRLTRISRCRSAAPSPTTSAAMGRTLR